MNHDLVIDLAALPTGGSTVYRTTRQAVHEVIARIDPWISLNLPPVNYDPLDRSYPLVRTILKLKVWLIPEMAGVRND